MVSLIFTIFLIVMIVGIKKIYYYFKVKAILEEEEDEITKKNFREDIMLKGENVEAIEKEKMMNKKNILKKQKKFSKVVILFLFCIFLQVPLSLVSNIVEERMSLYNETVNEIGREWGEKQVITGPIIVIPYSESYYKKEIIVSKDGDKIEKDVKKVRHNQLLLLPDDLVINSILEEESRNRGIYKTIVYTSNINLQGNFSKLKQKIPEEYEEIYYDKARVVFGVTDTKALLKINKFNLNGEKSFLESGTGVSSVALLEKGVSGDLADLEDGIEFEINFDIRGSKGISFIPLGEKNKFIISSKWPSPSFNGYLPSKSEITKEGFNATWDISSLTRNYSQNLIIKNDGIHKHNFLNEVIASVNLYSGITHYRQVIRATKYGLLFIALTMLIAYGFELISKKETHYIQYGIIGVSLVIFYLLLLSLSEHTSFFIAYILSTGATVLPISIYVAKFSKNVKFGIGMFIMLVGIYSVLYSILKMEDYALLTGTLLILIVIYGLMYMTRNTQKLLDDE